MRIHILGVPHTQTSEKFSTCAFTQKVVNLCKMTHRRGHEVFHYGVEGSDVECTEDIPVMSAAEWSSLYPPVGTGFYNLETGGKFAPYHARWAEACKAALKKRTGAPNTEIICLTWGGTQRDACNGVQQFQVESGIGYKHTWSDWRVYESYAWLHMQLGEAGLYEGAKWYWAVIPNSFDVSKFDAPTPGAKKGDDFLYIGRLNADKGIGLAIDVCKRIGAKITIVGQGDPTPYLNGNPHVSYLPPVGVEDRRKLLANAKAVFCPTFYVEPFCGVNVEAQLSGTPVITTDWGIFNETVLNGKTGYRCRTVEQMIWATKNVDKLSPQDCRRWAEENFSLERVALMYEEYFQQVLNVGRKEGFYTMNPNRTQLDWLTRLYPSASASAYDFGSPSTATQDVLYLSRPHEPPPTPVVVAPAAAPAALGASVGAEFQSPTSDAEWQEAQQFERQWWGLEWAANWDEELQKQQTYFRLIGMPEEVACDLIREGRTRMRDFGSKSILDVCCGPISLLQRSVHGFSRGVDPLAVSETTLKRYQSKDVDFQNIKAEDMPVDRIFDEVWMYNGLQHVQDPHIILDKIAIMGNVVRIFEWIDLGVCPGHPQNLTEDMFWQYFGGPEWDRKIWNVGQLRDFGGTVTNKYIAIHAVCRRQKTDIVAELRLRIDALRGGIDAFPNGAVAEAPPLT